MAGASEPDPVSTKQQQIAELAKQNPQMGLFSLAHHINLRWLYEAYLRVRKNGATGVDGQTAADYSAHLGDNLRSLLEQTQVRHLPGIFTTNLHIPKGTGDETRPIGIPTFEDKILQRAVVMVLEAVYEQDFLDCSYGFQPGRSTQAIGDFVAAHDEDGWWLDGGSRHPQVLRHVGSCPLAGIASAAGA